MAASDKPDTAGSKPTSTGDTIFGDKVQHWKEIHGDYVLRDKVLGDKINQYIFQGLADASARYKHFTEIKKQPYLPDRPFTPVEQPLFAGREEEIKVILRYLGDPQRQTIVIYGAADVGKTSLIAAGIIPGLFIVGALAVQLQEYGRPSAALQRELLAHAAGLNLELDKNGTSAQLVQEIVSRSEQGIVLILDQFERAFVSGVSPEMRQELRHELHSIITQVPPRYIHILIAIRDDMQFELDPPWRDLLPDLGKSVIHLNGLEFDEARKAIEQPVKLSRDDPQLFPPFYYDHEQPLIDELLLPDLDQLSSLNQKLILPADLQIVCFRLYEAAQKKEIPTIDKQLYWQISKNKGAAYIIDDHFQELMHKIPQAVQKLAQKVIRAMLEDLDNFWSTPDNLPIAGASTAEIAMTLEEMVRVDLLISHETDGQMSFAFASNSIANAAGRAAGPEYERKLEAKKQLGAIWRAWVIYDALAGKGQLRLVQQHSTENDPLKVLLLLRSAVAHEMPVNPWLERLISLQSRQLLRRIEEMRVEDSDQTDAEGSRHRAEDLLGILDQELPPRPPGFNAGPLTWTAVAHPDSQVVRETAILALMVAYEGDEETSHKNQRDALDRVDALWQANDIDRGRMAELVGILSNVREDLATRNKKRPFPDRFSIWYWRFRRYYFRDRAYIWALTAGAAAGAGLGLGLLRAVLGYFLTYGFGKALFFYAPVGFFLGGALALGVMLTNVVRLKPRDQEVDDFISSTRLSARDSASASDHQRPEIKVESVEKRPLLPSLAMGALCFGAMHLLLVILLRIGLVRTTLSHVFALAAGAALAFVIYDLPMANWRHHIGRWLLRLSIVAAIFALIQTFFILYDEEAFSLQISWSGFFYRLYLQENITHPVLTPILAIDRWYHYLAVIDAALVGFVMALGLAVGLLYAARWYRNWHALKVRAGE